MEGTVIGQYRVTKKLGEGGMGAVFAGEHSLIGRRAAIKMLLPALSQNQDIVQRFFNEARAATAIQDPGIVQIFDFGYHTDGSAYIVMEYLEGEPLDARLKRQGRLNPFDALRIMRQAASSLAAAHARGIIHRDLKPENIYLVADREVSGGERPKLLDFGIAKLTGDAESKVKTHTAAIMGTPLYMSPEQCRGAGQVDARSDVYALGCVIFHLITGKPPFDGEGVGEIIACHLREPPPSPSQFVAGLPPEVDMLVARCLAKPVDQRFQSAAELADAIGWMLGQGGQPLGAVHPSGQFASPARPTTLSGASGVKWSTANTGGPMVSPTGPGVAPQKSRVGLIVGAVGAVAVAAIAVVVLSSGGKAADGGGGAAQPAAGTAAGSPVAAPVGPVVAPPVETPPAVAVDAGTAIAVAPPVDDKAAADQAAADKAASDKSDARSERERKRREREAKRAADAAAKAGQQPASGSATKPPSSDTGGAGKCNNGVPGDTDCDGIPDTRL